MALIGELIIDVLINRLLMVHGSWLGVQPAPEGGLGGEGEGRRQGLGDRTGPPAMRHEPLKIY